jgi:hypothetical protein
MATIVNNPGGPGEHVVEKSDSSGWAVAVIILIAVLVVGGLVWLNYYGAPAGVPTEQGNQQQGSNDPGGNANINLTLPPNDDNDSNSNTNTGAGVNTGGSNSTTTP